MDMSPENVNEIEYSEYSTWKGFFTNAKTREST